MSARAWSWARRAGAASTLAVLLWRVGTGPFVDGLQMVDGRALGAATAIAVLTTLCCAWRWMTVARCLGVDLSLPAAVPAYYRSLFLNATLPGGVVGDLHRGVQHGRAVSDVGGALRAVVWERGAGQVVQLALTACLLLALPSPLHAVAPAAAVVAALVLGVAVYVARTRAGGGGRAWLGIALASAVVVGGHVLTFLVAARTAGVSASAAQLVPLALIALLGAALPNVGGWGPREGVTAWAFAAAGLGAGAGVETAVVYGVMTFVAGLPGAVVLVVAWFRRTRATARTAHA